MANREQLNAKATELGIENPENYNTKAELQAVIDAAEPQAPTPPEETGVVETSDEENATTSVEEGTSRDDAVAQGKSTAERNIEAERTENQDTGE